MTTSGSHLTSLLRQTKPNQNPDKTKNGSSSGHKKPHANSTWKCSTLSPTSKCLFTHSSVPSKVIRHQTYQTHSFSQVPISMRCDEIVKILSLITIANSAVNTNYIVGSTQPIYTFDELFKDMKTGVRGSAVERALETLIRATSHTRLKALDHGNERALIGRKGGDRPSSLHTRR